MRHRICDLDGWLLDAAVAKALGDLPSIDQLQSLGFADLRSFWVRDPDCIYATPLELQMVQMRRPSADWRDGGPIIELERIDISAPRPGAPSGWFASFWRDDFYEHEQSGPTPLIAAMRAYVASKFGDWIDLD